MKLNRLLRTRYQTIRMLCKIFSAFHENVRLEKKFHNDIIHPSKAVMFLSFHSHLAENSRGECFYTFVRWSWMVDLEGWRVYVLIHEERESERERRDFSLNPRSNPKPFARSTRHTNTYSTQTWWCIKYNHPSPSHPCSPSQLHVRRRKKRKNHCECFHSGWGWVSSVSGVLAWKSERRELNIMCCRGWRTNSNMREYCSKKHILRFSLSDGVWGGSHVLFFFLSCWTTSIA